MIKPLPIPLSCATPGMLGITFDQLRKVVTAADVPFTEFVNLAASNPPMGSPEADWLLYLADIIRKK